MEKEKKMDRVVLGLIILFILVSVLGVFMLIKALSFNDYQDSELKDSSSGSISLNIKNSQDEYSASGVITLDIDNNENDVLED
ncbi:hypothetical protein KO361_02545 [Candidatus Woesearchaeota archaeon]|nr:hypothetical protein [Candidatus Woesearchaeota archaeon]